MLSDEARPNASCADLPKGTVKLPADWRKSFGEDFRGRVCLTRGFNRPTGLEHGSRVFLCITAASGSADIALNDHSLGRLQADQAEQRFEITRLLQPSNQLKMIVDGTSGNLGNLAEVRLEIVERD
jgi:hypothetical protein